MSNWGGGAAATQPPIIFATDVDHHGWQLCSSFLSNEGKAEGISGLKAQENSCLNNFKLHTIDLFIFQYHLSISTGVENIFDILII